jgi:hypothetical protein
VQVLITGTPSVTSRLVSLGRFEASARTNEVTGASVGPGYRTKGLFPPRRCPLLAPTPVVVEVVTAVRPRLTEQACKVRTRLLRSGLPFAPLLF